MVEFGKRSRPQRGQDYDFRNSKRRAFDGGVKEEKNYDGGELVVYRILCPVEVIGSVIGKSGKVINTIRQDSRAKVKVVDPFPGAKDRVLLVYCYVKEKVDVDVEDGLCDYERPLCAAQDGLLRVHSAIVRAVAAAGEGDGDKKRGGFSLENGKVECQILVPSSQSANIIGKAGATIKKLRSRTKTYIKILPKDTSAPTHSCAMDFDNFVIINGEPESVRRALYAISSIMYKFGPKEEIPLVTSASEAPSIIIPSDIPIFPSGAYGTIDPIVPSGSVVPPILGATHVSDLHNYGDLGNSWSVYAPTLPVLPVGGGSQSEDLIVRVLCPSDKIGRVIGKAGSTIKSIRQASGAHIEVDDSKKDRDDCIITVRATEAHDDLKSMAVEATLLLQAKINDEDDDIITIRLLVPSNVIGCIIGRSGSIINEIRKRTSADIRISQGRKTRPGDANDELVEVSGEVAKVRDALIQIVLRLRDDVLKGRDESHNPSAGLESIGSGLPLPSALSSVPPAASLSHDKKSEIGKGFSSFYGYGSLSLGDTGYGALSSYSSKPYGMFPPSTLEILIPANAVGKVMGRGGANLENIRKISGASIDVSEPKSLHGDRIAYISGTPEEKRSAENLVQAFIMAT